MQDLTERRTSSTQVMRGSFLQVWRDDVQLPDGKTATREYVKHPGAVVIVALLDHETAVVERQFRYPLHRVMLEFPAGKLDTAERGAEGAGAVAGATPGVWNCATRELAEETGYTAAEWAYAGGMHNAIAYSDEIIHVCFARGLVAGSQRLDDGEFLSVETMRFGDLQAAMLSHQLTDAKTLTALLWWQQLRSGAWQPQWHEVGQLPVPAKSS